MQVSKTQKGIRVSLLHDVHAYAYQKEKFLYFHVSRSPAIIISYDCFENVFAVCMRQRYFLLIYLVILGIMIAGMSQIKLQKTFITELVMKLIPMSC